MKRAKYFYVAVSCVLLSRWSVGTANKYRPWIGVRLSASGSNPLARSECALYGGRVLSEPVCILRKRDQLGIEYDAPGIKTVVPSLYWLSYGGPECLTTNRNN